LWWTDCYWDRVEFKYFIFLWLFQRCSIHAHSFIFHHFYITSAVYDIRK
jgi:hypothetical protein